MNSLTETGDLNQLKYVNLRVLNQLYDTCLDTNLSTESREFTSETGDLKQLKYVNLGVLNQLYDTCLDTNLSTECRGD